MYSCMSYLGITIGILALGCAVCALGLEYWVKGYFEDLPGDAFSGLWRRCTDTQTGGKSCEDFDTFDNDYKPALNAVRSMVIIGTFFVLLSVIVACFSLVVNKLSAQSHLGFIASLGMTIGGLFLMIGFAVYLEEIFYPIGWAVLYDLNAAFILCVLGWILSWTSAALILAGMFANKRQKLLLL